MTEIPPGSGYQAPTVEDTSDVENICGAPLMPPEVQSAERAGSGPRQRQQLEMPITARPEVERSSNRPTPNPQRSDRMPQKPPSHWLRSPTPNHGPPILGMPSVIINTWIGDWSQPQVGVQIAPWMTMLAPLPTLILPPPPIYWTHSASASLQGAQQVTYGGVLASHAGVIAAHAGVIAAHAGIVAVNAGIAAAHSGAIAAHTGARAASDGMAKAQRALEQFAELRL